MLILGLDAAQATGWALYDTNADLSSIRVGVLKAVGDDYEHKAASLGFALMKLIKDDRPDFIALEASIKMHPGAKQKVKFMGEETQETGGGSGMNAVISSNQMVGAVSAIIGAYRIPFETITSGTWRKQFLGFGRRPGWQRKDWKRAARERCAQLRINVTNDDQADAVGIAYAGASTQTFKLLQARAAEARAA